MDIKQSFPHKITIISGEKDVGKTKLCSLLIEKITSQNKQVTGIISPGIYSNGQKINIFAEDISTHEKVKLASYAPGWDKENPVREWRFEMEAMPWGNEKIKHSVPTEYLIIDEIGYLEFEKGEGWVAALQVLDQGLFSFAFIVVRPTLVEAARQRWKDSEILVVRKSDDLNVLAGKLLTHLIESV